MRRWVSIPSSAGCSLPADDQPGAPLVAVLSYGFWIVSSLDV